MDNLEYSEVRWQGANKNIKVHLLLGHESTRDLASFNIKSKEETTNVMGMRQQLNIRNN